MRLPMAAEADPTGALLREAWASLGGEADLLGLVTVTGDGVGLTG
jgi:hypothetical protein